MTLNRLSLIPTLLATLLLSAVAVSVCVAAPADSMLLPQQQRVFSTYDASDGLADNSAQTIMCTKTGRIVTTTIGHVNFYDGSSFTHIDPTQDNIYPLAKYNGHYHMYFDKAHHLWLKDKHQVTCVDLLTERFITDVQGVLKEMGVKGTVDDLFADASNHMWFLLGRKLYGADLDKYMPVRMDAELQDVDVYRDSLMMQFFGNGTMAVYDVKAGRHLYDTRPYDDAASARYDKSSVLYPYETGFFQIRNGDKEAVLLHYDMETRKWEQVMAVPYHLNNMAINNQRLYVASEYGYWMCDLKTGRKNHHEELVLTRGRRLSTDINALAFDRQGGMWVGTEKRGLLYSKPFRSPFVIYDWSQPEALRLSHLMDSRLASAPTLPRRTNCVYQDSRGWTWTGTYTGLQLQKTKDGPVQVFTRHDGLTNEMIHSVIEDSQHNIWVSTSYGICQLTIKGGNVYHVESYVDSDNVPHESFVNGRAIRLDDGTIVMQTLDCVLTFNPESFHSDSLRNLKLYPKLIRLMVNGRNVKPGMEIDGKVILDRSITRIREVSVNYNQNSLVLTFSGLNYLRPTQTYYRFRVKGFYNSWHILSHADSDGLVDSKGLLHLPLVGLPPGKYEVELQASMSPDNWPMEPFVWVVQINEPWWRATGVYLLLGLLLLGVLVANGIFYNRNTRRRMQLNNAENDMLRRIRNYVERCDGFMNEVLTPYTLAVEGHDETHSELNEDFVNVMLQVVPYVKEHHDFTMSELSSLTGVKLGRLYELISNDIYKTPRQLAESLRLQQAAQLLATTDLELEDIADRCGFVSPNYFIACFFHHYRKTPQDYRKTL